MLNHKKLIEMARKWRQTARADGFSDQNSGTETSPVKGHVVVYSMDRKRFMVPVSYLGSDIFRELLDMAEELFGLPSDGPITLPCDAEFLQNVISSHKRRSSENVERHLLSFISSSRCSASPLYQGSFRDQMLVCSS